MLVADKVLAPHLLSNSHVLVSSLKNKTMTCQDTLSSLIARSASQCACRKVYFWITVGSFSLEERPPISPAHKVVVWERCAEHALSALLPWKPLLCWASEVCRDHAMTCSSAAPHTLLRVNIINNAFQVPDRLAPTSQTSASLLVLV